MANYRPYGGHGRSSAGSHGHQSGGFINRRTGSYVSSTRAHQHTGQSFGGYTKSRSSATGNYYMRRS